MIWQVIYLRPRCEKKMAIYAVKLSVEFYLPLREETKVYQRRKVTVEKPVFPGYLFVALDADLRAMMLKSDLVIRTFEPPDEEKFLHELEQVRKALAVDPTLGSCAALAKGNHVLIKGGPFMGIEGIVEAVRGLNKVRLNIEMINQAVEVEVTRDFLELLD